MESRFGPHFPAVEGRKVDKGIAALLGTFYVRVTTCGTVILARVCICLLLVSFGLSYVRTLLDVR